MSRHKPWRARFKQAVTQSDVPVVESEPDNSPIAGKYAWCYELIGEQGQRQIHDTYAGPFGGASESLIAWFLSRWSKGPNGAKWSAMSFPDPVPVVRYGRAIVLYPVLLVMIKDLLERRAIIAHQGDVERAIQESIREMAAVLGFPVEDR